MDKIKQVIRHKRIQEGQNNNNKMDPGTLRDPTHAQLEIPEQLTESTFTIITQENLAEIRPDFMSQRRTPRTSKNRDAKWHIPNGVA